MAKKEDEITLTIVKSLEREPLDYEEVILLKDTTIAELMSKHGLNDIQASAVYTWLTHEFRRYDKEAKENLEELNEIFSWIKSKFKKGQTSKDINPTEIFNKLNKLEQSHNGHKIFWSDKTDNYLITVIGYTNWWITHLGTFVKQYFDASNDLSRNKSPFLDKDMSDFYPNTKGTPSSADDSYRTYHYIQNVLKGYTELLDELARAVDHFHTAGNIYERKQFKHNPNVVAKLFLAIEEYLRDQAVYQYVGQDKLFVEELTANNFFKLKSEIKAMVENLGVKANVSSARMSDVSEAKVVSMIVCTAIASFLHKKSQQIKNYIKFFETEYDTLSNLDADINWFMRPDSAKKQMDYIRDSSLTKYLNDLNKYDRN